jgi:hypothetical protein
MDTKTISKPTIKKVVVQTKMALQDVFDSKVPKQVHKLPFNSNRIILNGTIIELPKKASTDKRIFFKVAGCHLNERFDSERVNNLFLVLKRFLEWLFEQVDELDRVMLAWKLDYDLLREYVSGDLPSHEAALIKEHIPQEILETVTATSIANRDITITVNNALKSNCIFPTPHAFRHTWAEAVYRRFDGDAGCMIRSHFKHISQSMWLAYTRNKDNQIIHSQVKRDVISSILTNFAKRGGDGYSGKIVQFINRGLKNTHMLRADGSIDSDVIDDFALSQIADIKSSPCGYCLLQRLDQDKENCAINGAPQRFNASPKFCLGCNDFFTHATNIEGILMSIAGDVKALYAPIPMVFKEASKATVSEAYTHLNRLNASEEILNSIKAALNAVSAKEKILC